MDSLKPRKSKAFDMVENVGCTDPSKLLYKLVLFTPICFDIAAIPRARAAVFKARNR